MKRILAVVIFLSCFLLSCNQNSGMTETKSMNDDVNTIKKPESQYLTRQQLQEQINREIQDAYSAAQDSTAADAAVVVAETNNAIRYLIDSNYAAAQKAIETALGKAEVITSSKPNLTLVPLELRVDIQDLVADMETLKKIRDQVEDLTDKGYLQAARRMLEGLASEITISTSSLPLGTYPDALRAAAKLTRERKALEAAMVLNDALHTIVVEETSIPLPLVRAERMLTAVDSLLHKSDRKNDQNIDVLLDNADYQIRFAEALGYGKKDKEFSELYSAIKDLRAEVKKKERTAKVQEMTTNLRNKLRGFKTRISKDNKSKK
jgi:hypothetical protein